MKSRKTPKRPGPRPLLGDRALTAAEKKARQRARARKEGARVFEVSIRGDVREKIEEIAAILRIPASAALRLCAEAGVGDMWLTAQDVRDRERKDPAERRARKHIADTRRTLARSGVPVDDLDRALVGRFDKSLEELEKEIDALFAAGSDDEKGGPNAD